MQRREFITLLGGASAAWPLAAAAQQPAPPVIGWLSGRNAETEALLLPAFHRGLSAQGFVEGRNVSVEYSFADAQYDRLPRLAIELIQRPVSVLIGVGNALPAIRTVRAEGSTIPIVFIIGEDPVKLGLVANLNRPGGNTTGVVNHYNESAPKRMGLLHDLFPKATTFAVLFNPAGPASRSEASEVEEAARTLGQQIKTLTATTEGEIDVAFASAAQMRADAILLLTDPLFFARANRVIALAARYAIPALYFRREFAAAGGLMTYGSNVDDTYRIAGEYAGRILKGEKAGDLPVQQATKFEFVINLKTAKTLGLAIPPMLLALADSVIE
jgi:putative tryptophan/tyrosine transport system substrate-binding protein